VTLILFFFYKSSLVSRHNHWYQLITSTFTNCFQRPNPHELFIGTMILYNILVRGTLGATKPQMIVEAKIIF
jgi:hypothetical protein